MTVLIGAHVGSGDPLGEANRKNADAVQMFLGNPQSWKKPPPRRDAAELTASGMPIYVHANYLINVVSPNNRIRIPSRKNLADALEAAASIGARGLIVHGGHVGDDEDRSAGLVRWEKALDSVEALVPILIENTAGGDNAVARRIDDIAALWERIGDRGVGFCLDTCHAWSAGEDLETIVERVLDATGRIDLVHLNDSRDPSGSGRDRHANLGHGEIPPDLLVEVVRRAGATVILETPDDDGGQAADIAWLRDRLPPA